MMNATVGDCTVAAAGHMTMLWTANSANIHVPTDAEILKDYSRITGYDERDPNSDTGAAELDVLNFWRKSGIAGHLIIAYMAIDIHNVEQIKAAIHLFGGLYIGLAMPDNWEGQLDNGEPWTWRQGDRVQPENGHAVPLVGYDENFLTCITWGQKQKMSWEWFHGCCDEAYVVLSPDWISGPNSPSALNMAELVADLRAL